MDIFSLQKHNNPLSQENQQTALIRWHKHSYIFLSTTLFIVIILYALKAYQTPALHVLKERKISLEDTYQELHTEFDKHTTLYKAYTQRLTLYKQRCKALLYYLEHIASIMPEDARLNTLELQNSTLKLTGCAHSLKSLTIFLKRLRYEAAHNQDTITEIKKKNNPGKDPAFALLLELNNQHKDRHG